MDFSSFESVRQGAEKLRALVTHLDICVLNAGIMRTPLRISENLEIHQKVNHFSQFLLLNEIMDLIEKSPNRPRVISVSSMAHTMGEKNGGQMKYWRTFENEEEYKKEMIIYFERFR